MTFGTDQVLAYNVQPWVKLGFGVPNFSENHSTVNKPIWRLADEIGKLQLFIMTHVDAARTRPPSRNTIERLGKMMNRINSVLLGRGRNYNELRLEEGHGAPSPAPWNIHPVPYFQSEIVRNHWLQEYNELTMMALTNIYQHSDNNLALTITQELASDVWSYFREVKMLLGRELIGISSESGLTEDLLKAEDFQFQPQHYAAYHPERVTVRIESLDGPGEITARFTEDDLRPFLIGIPANLIIPNLAKYPIGPVDDSYSGSVQNDFNRSNPGTDTGSSLEPVI